MGWLAKAIGLVALAAGFPLGAHNWVVIENGSDQEWTLVLDTLRADLVLRRPEPGGGFRDSALPRRKLWEDGAQSLDLEELAKAAILASRPYSVTLAAGARLLLGTRDDTRQNLECLSLMDHQGSFGPERFGCIQYLVDRGPEPGDLPDADPLSPLLLSPRAGEGVALAVQPGLSAVLAQEAPPGIRIIADDWSSVERKPWGSCQ